MRAFVTAFALVFIAGTAAGDPYSDAARRSAEMDASTRAEQLKNPNSEASLDAQAEADARAKEQSDDQHKNSGTSDCGAGYHRSPTGDCLAGSLGNPATGNTPPPVPAPLGGMQPGPARMP